jgi:methylenetetrahydrofolate dehydrogenase (NADP+) / methenyltetrahydrofolate cyclohydrolase
MKIDGNRIAAGILEDLKKKVGELKKKNIIPHLAIVLIGKDHSSKIYVNQKKIKGEGIGAKISIFNFSDKLNFGELKELVDKLNNDPKVHGIIIQRPIPPQINEMEAREIVLAEKDVDGFLPNSKFNEPIAEAVLEILKTVFRASRTSTPGVEPRSFENWLSEKNIVVVGKGKTGGRPVINLLNKLEIEPLIVDSKTLNSGRILKSGDIIISTVGKHGIIKTNEIKNGAIVIGIGMHKGNDGKLRPDYNQEEIAKISSFYTPVPGGVGPVNVAMLLKNLIKSAT